MSLFEDYLSNGSHHSRKHARDENRRYGQNGYDDHFDDQQGNYGYNNKHAIASALKPHMFSILKNKTFLIIAGIACFFVLLGVVALVAALAPLAMKLVKLIEQNGIKGILDLINLNGLKGLLDLVSQILGLVEKAGGK
jgi:hypothetical protein